MIAVEKKVFELCTLKCGKLPTSNQECEAFNKGKASCKVRRISDDADFHVEMKWTDNVIASSSPFMGVNGLEITSIEKGAGLASGIVLV